VFPNFSFWRAKLLHGWTNFAFIVDGKSVIKIRKEYLAETPDRVLREKRITDAFRKILPVAIPNIEVASANGYAFIKYDMLDGKGLNVMPADKLAENREKLGRQLARFLYALHGNDPPELHDLKDGVQNGEWTHGDLARNMLVDPQTMDLTGIIDWEFAGYMSDINFDFGRLSHKKQNKRLADSGLVPLAEREYEKLKQKGN
jgi:aminoglycoside phosphotransferase (APT) family kinase protein